MRLEAVFSVLMGKPFHHLTFNSELLFLRTLLINIADINQISDKGPRAAWCQLDVLIFVEFQASHHTHMLDCRQNNNYKKYH